VHVTLRRTAAVALAAALAVPALLVAAPSASAVTETHVVGLYGVTDPTYDGVYRQSLAILGLHAAGRAPRPEAVQWLLSQQCPDGSFTSYKSTVACPPFDPGTFTGGADSNATATAAEALFALGTTATKAAAAEAAAYLRGVQLVDGSWEYNPGNSGAGDPNSTGLVLLALDAAGLTPVHDPAPFFADLQVGRTDFVSHSPASDRGAISTTFAPGAPNLLATVQTVAALRGASLSTVPDLSGAWQDGATSYAVLPPSTAVGVGGWAAAYLAGQVNATGAASYAAADETAAAWTVLSLAADRTSETTARALATALEARPAVTSPAANGQDALAAAAVGHTDAAAVFADRIDASLTRDLTSPGTTWAASTSAPFTGQYVYLKRTAISDDFWPTTRLVLQVTWGDGVVQKIAGTSEAASHQYFAPGAHTVLMKVTDPSGNTRTSWATTVVVRPDLVAPTARVLTPTSSSRRSAWKPVVVTAGDYGSGVAQVRVRISQQRKGSWVSWNGSGWVAGTRATVAASRVAGTHRWTVVTPTLALGRLVVAARATDRVGLSSSLSSSSVTLRR